MKWEVRSKVAAAFVAACLVPALALCQPVPSVNRDDPGGPEGPQTIQRVWINRPLGPDADMGMGPGMEMGMGPGMGMGMGPGMGMGMRLERGPEMELDRVINDAKLREQLGITTEQVAQIRQESLASQKAEILSRADLQVKRLELRSLLEAETPDRAEIDKSLREANAAQLVVEKAAIEHQLATRALLTPEQREKLKQMGPQFHLTGAGPGEGGGMMMRPAGGGNFMYMRAPRVEKRVIVRSGEPSAMPAPPPAPDAPPAPKQ